MNTPIYCAGCGQEITGEPYRVERVYPGCRQPDPRAIGIVFYFCEASHYGEQFSESLLPSVAEAEPTE